MASCYVLLVSRRVNEPVIVRSTTTTPPPQPSHPSGLLPSSLLISHYPLDNVYTAVRNQQCPTTEHNTQAPSPKHNQNDDTLGRPCKPAVKSSALSWDVTQRRLVVIYRRFGQPIGPIFKGQVITQHRYITISLGCVRPQKSAELI